MIVEGSIFISDQVAQECGNRHGDELISGKIIKRHAEDMITSAGHNPQILVSADTSYQLPPPAYHPKHSFTTLQALDHLRTGGEYKSEGWLENHSDVRESFNLMLIPSGLTDGTTGRGTLSNPHDGKPRACMKRGGVEIADHPLRSDQTGPRASAVEGIIRGCLHEIGHNMGARHKHGFRWEGFDGWDEQPTYATLMGCTSATDYETSCGDSCSSRETTDWFHRFSDCAEDNMVW